METHPVRRYYFAKSDEIFLFRRDARRKRLEIEKCVKRGRGEEKVRVANVTSRRIADGNKEKSFFSGSSRKDMKVKEGEKEKGRREEADK